MLVYCSVV